MTDTLSNRLTNAIENWTAPDIGPDIPHGDMPGDKIVINAAHIEKARVIFPRLLPLLKNAMEQNGAPRAVAAVCGGSGVGKSETASLLAHYLRRIPAQNDAERLRVYRCGGIRGLLTANCYTAERSAALMELMEKELDASAEQTNERPWLAVYQQAARDALSGYLGSSEEQDFDQLTDIISRFKRGDTHIWLKRMGRTPEALWYEKVDFSQVSVLIIEWTHGNSEKYQGVDVPVLLNSTPEETREHRRQRNRDGKTDSAFTTVVLELEQKMLESQAARAKLIISKNGSILSYAQYRSLMAENI